MEQFQTVSGMLDLMQRPAFCVRNQTIVKINTAAAPFLIETGTDVKSLLHTGAEEYAELDGGCLYLTLSISGHILGASVMRMEDLDIFTIDAEEADPRMQALALAAREMREPLSNVMTMTDQLFPSLDADDSKVQDQISRINRGLFQMLRILGNMSDAEHYTTDTGARQEIRDICAVMAEIFSRGAALAAHTGVTIHYTGCPESTYMLADAPKLERMVLNILSNALKFTPAGGTITAKLIRRGTRMYLSVHDSGSGIAENLRGNLFSRYAREAGVEDSRYGLGLGMVLIRSTAAVHGGTVLIDHPDGVGTRITVSFAIRQGNASLRSPRMRIDYAGERDHGLIELSDVLPAHLYRKDLIN